jgi:ribosome-associated toxin RatA of RatAB toxin-antitoxin module
MATTVRAAAKIPLPIETCWKNLTDLTRAKDYVPGLTDSVITTEKKEGVGASRIVSHRQFGDMNETVVAWDEGVGMTIRLHKGDGPATPFKEAHFRYEFRASPGSPEECEIHTALTYVLPGGIFGQLFDTLFLGRIFRRNVVDTAVCLAENYRTGEPVDHARLRELRRNAL